MAFELDEGKMRSMLYGKEGGQKGGGVESECRT